VRPSDSPNLPYQTSTPNRSVIRPERTWISCHAALDKSTCAPFRKEGRMKCINATKFHRKSGGAKWRDLLFTIPRCRPQMEAPPSPLSSRPERSAVEGSAVRPSDSPNLPYQTSTPLRTRNLTQTSCPGRIALEICPQKCLGSTPCDTRC
jgi:hypothetical protein